jgi:hypothetical protein
MKCASLGQHELMVYGGTKLNKRVYEAREIQHCTRRVDDITGIIKCQLVFGFTVQPLRLYVLCVSVPLCLCVEDLQRQV